MLAYQHTCLSLFFYFTLLSHQSFSFLSAQNFFHQRFFTPPPPGSCHPFFTLYPTLHLPDFLQPACFSACLLLLRVSLCPCGTAHVSLFVSVCYSSKREGRQVSNTKRRVPRPCPSPFYSPILSPCLLLINPTTRAPCKAVDDKKSHEPLVR